MIHIVDKNDEISSTKSKPSGDGFKTCINYANELESEARAQNQFEQQRSEFIFIEKIGNFYGNRGRFRTRRE